VKRLLAIVGACLVSFAGVAAGWLYFWPHDERTFAALHSSSGEITKGRRFQVEVGDNWRLADHEIRSQFQPDYILWETPSPTPAYSQPADSPVLIGDATVTYRDRSWRNGLVMLSLHDGRVIKIHWDYSPLYIDL
jgi:hypothetical protein